MSFSSITFIWIFLPVLIAGYLLISLVPCKKNIIKNIFLLVMSLVFYLWGDIRALPLFCGLIVCCWGGAILLGKTQSHIVKNIIFVILILLNLGALGYFKYLNFIVSNINAVFGLNIQQREAYFPLGISFIVFQVISYIADVYKREIKPEKSLINFSLYMALFVQLISGPIVRYKDLEKSLTERTIIQDNILIGIKRFIRGLAKKVVIADCLGYSVDTILNLDQTQIGSALAWFVWFGYSLQIYYDFSGYTDMAIGVGQAFGFNIPENFNLPYLSQSVQEFWRRWHITLSSWFRDYLYIPLGGNRKGKIRTYINLVIVFAATGLWHGASWNFIFWGLWHGIFMLIERAGFGKCLKKNPVKIVNIIYTVGVTFTGWMFFRISSLQSAFYLIKVMLIPTSKAATVTTYYFLNPYITMILIMAVLFCGPVQVVISKAQINFSKGVWKIIAFFSYAFILIYSLSQVVSSTYSAFIYQQF